VERRFERKKVGKRESRRTGKEQCCKKVRKQESGRARKSAIRNEVLKGEHKEAGK
jgi:hypothetical protein